MRRRCKHYYLLFIIIYLPWNTHSARLTQNIAVSRLCVVVNISHFIRVTSIFSGVHFSSSKKLTFLVVALKTQAKTTKLTTPTVHISPISSKIRLLLCLGGCMLCPGVHLQLSLVNLALLCPGVCTCCAPRGYACVSQPQLAVDLHELQTSHCTKRHRRFSVTDWHRSSLLLISADYCIGLARCDVCLVIAAFTIALRVISQSISLFRHTQTLFTEQCNQTKHSY